MTAPISTSTSVASQALAAQQPGWVLSTAGRMAAGEGPAIITETGGAASSPRAGDATGFGLDLALQLELLQARKAEVQATCEKQKAGASHKAEIAAVRDRLEELARAASEKARSEKSSFWSKVFKWVAAVVAAVAAAVSSVFTGAGGATIAAVVIAAVILSDEVVKAVTGALVEAGALSDKAASIVNACFGVVEDLITQLGESGALGEKGETVAAALNLALGAAKAIVSCVAGGVSGVNEIVGAACTLTAEAVRLAQEVVVIVYEALGKEEQLSQELMLALSLVSLCLDVAGMACSVAEGSRGGAGAGLNPAAKQRIAALATSVLGSAGAGFRLGQASFEAARGVDSADAGEAEDLATSDADRAEAARARIEEARAALEKVFEELDAVRDDVEGLLELRDQAFAALLSPGRA